MKTSLKLTIITLFLSLSIQAQVFNAGFESGYNLDSTINGWTNNTAYVIDINDSILFDGPLYSLSTQARTGNYALELRNMYNVTQSFGYEGQIAAGYLDTSTTFHTFRFNFPISTKPSSLSYYYRFAQNPFNDSTFCKVRILNSSEEIIGAGTSLVWDVNTNFQQKLTDIVYDFSSTSDTIPAYAAVFFQNRITATPHVGQRILIDDIALQTTPTSTYNVDKTFQFNVVPNPANSFISIFKKGFTFSSFEILNTVGQVVLKSNMKDKIDISALPNANYYIRAFDKEKVYTQKWIKQ